MLYDSTEYGKSNKGHIFGSFLEEDERKSVIELLKTVSGPGVEPSS